MPPRQQPESRHPYVPWFSFGNIASTVGIVGAGIAVWIALQVSVARADEKIVYLQKEVTQDRESTGKRLEQLENRVAQIDNKTNDMAVKQAALLANIELLMRAQGLRPVEARQ